MNDTDGSTDSESTTAVEGSSVDFLHIPTSSYGVIRQVKNVIFRCSGLRITDGNIEDLLPCGLGDQSIGACARELLHQLTRWEDIIVIDAADLGNLEKMWSGADTSSFHKYNKPTEFEFCVKFQYRCYIDLNWNIIRELSYLAVSPAALLVLVRLGSSQRKVRGLHSLSERLRRCSGTVLRETFDCIRSGSSWQVLRAALSSTAFYLQPGFATHEPSDRRVAFFSLGYVRSTKFSGFLHNLGEEFSSRHQCYSVCSVLATRDNEVLIEGPPHGDFSCRRCLASCQNAFALRNWNPAHFPSRSACGAMLISALRPEDIDREHQDRHELCLYLFEESPALLERTPFSTIIERLAQDGQMYHTILQRLSTHDERPDGVLWNLSWPYRKSTKRQQFDVARWTHDLAEYGSPFEQKLPKSWMHIWVHQQMLLYYLRTGMGYDGADAALRAFRNESRRLYCRHRKLPFNTPDLPLYSVQLSRFWAKVKQDGDDDDGMLD